MKKIIRLKEKYYQEVVPKLMSEFGIKNKMAVPKILKVVINSGIGDALKDKSLSEQAREDIKAISGQMPQIRKSKVSVASFAIRRGMDVGLRVTLRGEKMYSFLDRLFSIVLPRLRDFRGLSERSFDKNGNYSIGIVEHVVFPEIDLAKTRSRGLEATIVTNSRDSKISRKLLEYLGMPFEK